MKHVKALVIKAIMIWAIVWIVLTGLYDVSFMDSTIVGLIIVVGIYSFAQNTRKFIREMKEYLWKAELLPNQ